MFVLINTSRLFSVNNDKCNPGLVNTIIKTGKVTCVTKMVCMVVLVVPDSPFGVFLLLSLTHRVLSSSPLLFSIVHCELHRLRNKMRKGRRKTMKTTTQTTSTSESYLFCFNCRVHCTQHNCLIFYHLMEEGTSPAFRLWSLVSHFTTRARENTTKACTSFNLP